MPSNLSVQRKTFKMVLAPLRFLPVLATSMMFVCGTPGSLAFSNSFSLLSWKLPPQGRQLRWKEIASKGPRMLLQPSNRAVPGGLQAISTASVSFRDVPLHICKHLQIEAIKKKMSMTIRHKVMACCLKCCSEPRHVRYTSSMHAMHCTRGCKSQGIPSNTVCPKVRAAQTDVDLHALLTPWLFAVPALFRSSRAELADIVTCAQRNWQCDP
jgi:hypothetical protein